MRKKELLRQNAVLTERLQETDEKAGQLEEQLLTLNDQLAVQDKRCAELVLQLERQKDEIADLQRRLQEQEEQNRASVQNSGKAETGEEEADSTSPDVDHGLISENEISAAAKCGETGLNNDNAPSCVSNSPIQTVDSAEGKTNFPENAPTEISPEQYASSAIGRIVLELSSLGCRLDQTQPELKDEKLQLAYGKAEICKAEIAALLASSKNSADFFNRIDSVCNQATTYFSLL